jgi:hypothetical protein
MSGSSFHWNRRTYRDRRSSNCREFLSATAICNLERSHTRRGGIVLPHGEHSRTISSVRVICLANRIDPGLFQTAI